MRVWKAVCIEKCPHGLGGGVGISSSRYPAPTLPRRCAARFTRARCGDSRTRKDEKQQQRELGKCGYPHERFLAGDRSGSDRKRFFSSPPTQAPLPGGKFGLRTTTSVFRRGVWTAYRRRGHRSHINKVKILDPRLRRLRGQLRSAFTLCGTWGVSRRM
jgi:hypothetical protein